MRGDLLLYRPGKREWLGRLIAWATHGPYCHVEIALDDDDYHMLGAHINGVGLRLFETPDMRITTRAFVDNAAIDHGLAWALAHNGVPYGWDGILSNVLKFFKLPLYMGVPDTYTCSEFAAHFLDQAGFDLDELSDCYDTISPNDLDRFFQQPVIPTSDR